MSTEGTEASPGNSDGPAPLPPDQRRLDVTWVGGAWFIATAGTTERIVGDGRWLDAWLRTHRLTRADLAFGDSQALRQRFINDFGRVPTA